MSKKTIISATGYPGTTKSWKFLQEILTENLTAISNMAGNAVIISGVLTDGTTVSPGYIVYNSEIYLFEGGLFHPTVSIIETVDNVQYNTDINDDTVLDSLPAYITRIAKCGTGFPNTALDFNFSELVRIKTLQELALINPALQIEVNANEATKYVTGETLNGRFATSSRRGVSKLASSNAVAEGNNNEDVVTPYAMKSAGIIPLKFTSGSIVTSSSTREGYVYPPTGYTMSNFSAFLPSINRIWFAGVVDLYDTLKCYYTIEYNRIRVYCDNTEQENPAIFNYLAIWHK